LAKERSLDSRGFMTGRGTVKCIFAKKPILREGGLIRKKRGMGEENKMPEERYKQKREKKEEESASGERKCSVDGFCK